jgi:rhodanese-related sulfurtransferase
MPERNIAITLTPREVKQRLDDAESLALIDVREPHEYEMARIEGATLIPMNTARSPALSTGVGPPGAATRVGRWQVI